jgi:hypothetical protein
LLATASAEFLESTERALPKYSVKCSTWVLQRWVGCQWWCPSLSDLKSGLNCTAAVPVRQVSMRITWLPSSSICQRFHRVHGSVLLRAPGCLQCLYFSTRDSFDQLDTMLSDVRYADGVVSPPFEHAFAFHTARLGQGRSASFSRSKGPPPCCVLRSAARSRTGLDTHCAVCV